MQIRDQKKSLKENKKVLFLCSALSRFSSLALPSTDPEPLIAQILKEVDTIFNAKSSWIFLIEDHKIKLKSLENTKSKSNLIRTKLVPKLSPGILKCSHPIICNDTSELGKKNRVLYNFVRGQNIRKFMGVLIKKNGKVIGTLNVGRDFSSPNFGRDDLTSLTVIGTLIEPVIGKQDEVDLKPSQEFLKVIIDNIPNPIIIKNKKHRWVILNKAVSDLLGYPRQEMMNKSDYDFFTKEHADFFWKQDKEIFRTGKIVDIPEKPITDKKGNVHYIRTKKAPLRDSSGKITHLVGLIEDITERKQAEEDLKTIKKQLEFILGATKTGVDIIDSKFDIRYIDPEWQKVYGDPAGIKCYKYFMGRSRVCPGCGIVAAFKTKKPTVTEEVLVKEGNRPIQVTTIPFQNEKGEWMVAEANVDITERKKAEEVLQTEHDRLELVTRHIGVGLAIISKDYRTLWANEVLKHIFGDVEGKTCYSTYNQRTEICPQCGVREVFQTGSSEVVHEQVGKDKHRKTIWSQIIAAPIKDKKGNITAVLEVVVPITERKRAEDALKESENRYRNLIESAIDIVYTFSLDGIITSLNPSFETITGWEIKDWIGKYFTDLIHPEELSLAMKLIQESIDGKERPRNEFRLLKKTGDYVLLDFNAKPLLKDGKLIGFFGIARDITERKRMEKLLIQRERTARERARLLTDLRNLYEIDDILTRVCETVRDSGLFERAVMTLHEPGGKIINVGQVGLPPQIVERARQAPPLDRKLISRMTHKNFRISDSFLISVEAGMDLTRSGRYIPQKRKKQGNGNWQAGDELFVPLRDFSGKIMGYLSVDSPVDGCRPDVTTIQALEMIVEAAAARVREVEANKALQRSEEKYRTLVETAQVGIGIMDPEENLVFVNQALANLLGYRKEEFLGKKLKDICDEEQYAMFKNEMEKRKKGESSKYEAKLLTKRGMSKHVYVSSAPLRTRDGIFIGSQTVLSDLTEIKKVHKYNILLNTSRALSQTLKFNQVLKMGAEKMMETLHADRCIVLLSEDHTAKPPSQLHVYNSKDKKVSTSVINLKITKEPLSAYKRTLRAREYIQISDARTDPMPELGKKILRQAGIKSSLIIPLVLGEKTLAIFHVGLVEKTKTFTPEEVGLVQTMATQVATALQNCKLMEDLERNHSQILQQAGLLKTQYREQKMLYELTQELSSSLYLDQLLRLATQKTTELLNIERSSILLLNPDGKTATIRVIYTQGKPSPSEFVGFTFDSDNFPMVKRVLTQKRLVNIPDVQAMPKENPLRKYYLSRRIKSTAAVPLISSGKFLGFLTVATTTELHSFTPQEIHLLQTLSNPIAMTIENKLLLEDLKGQTEKLKNQTQEKDILLKVSQAFSQTMDLHEVTKVAAQVVGTALRTERCAVSLITPDGNHMKVKGFYSEDPVDAQRLIDKQFTMVDEAKWKNIITKRKLLVTNDLSATLSGSELRKHCLKEGIKSVLATGMFFGKKLVGVLSISCIKEQRTFSQEEMKLIQTIANQIAVAIENTRLMEVVKKHTQDLKDLSSQLMKVQENERKRIAQELHDEVGQMLQSMKMNLDRIRRNLTGEPSRTEDTKDWLIDTEKLLSQTIDDIRTLTFDLRPSMLDDFGLISTLRWYIGDFAKRSNIKVVLKGKEEKYRFPLEIEVNLYRIIQEALTNVAKHAHATEVSIFLSQKDTTQTGGRLPTAILSLKDNGIGFDASTLLSYPQKGMGIFNMKERVNLLGGSFEIISHPKKGTRVNVKIPFTEVKHEEDQITGC